MATRSYPSSRSGGKCILPTGSSGSPQDPIGTVVGLGGTMAEFLDRNEYVIEYVDSFARLSERRFFCSYKGRYIELIGVKSGSASILEALAGRKSTGMTIGVGFFGGIAASVTIGD